MQKWQHKYFNLAYKFFSCSEIYYFLKYDVIIDVIVSRCDITDIILLSFVNAVMMGKLSCEEKERIDTFHEQGLWLKR